MDQREAIAGSDYVISVIRQGGLDAFQLDIDIPLQYGVDQCVGDTICAGGIMYGQRTIPVLLDICRDIREVARPGCPCAPSKNWRDKLPPNYGQTWPQFTALANYE